jgi:hemerythrin-like domain-containing protein
MTGAVLIERAAQAKKPAPKEDVSPTEDLMREHGVLRRILLVYDEIVRRVSRREPVPADAVAHAAQIVRDFIEDYHEKDEEEFVFPAVKKNHAGLVEVLLAQHRAGRKITDSVLRLATPAALGTPSGTQELAMQLVGFNRMYRAHAAREDTVLFPAFRASTGEKELDRLQDVFEKKEKALPNGGFDEMVKAVAGIEGRLGIEDLAGFTPA